MKSIAETWRTKSPIDANRTWAFWVTGISVTQSGAFRWDWSESCRSLDDAIDKIEQARKTRGDIASAWVKDDNGEMLYHGVYINLFGELDESRM